MPLILGKNSYCYTYNESGDVDNIETVVGKYTGIHSINIFACFSTGHFVGEISHFPFFLARTTFNRCGIISKYIPRT